MPHAHFLSPGNPGFGGKLWVRGGGELASRAYFKLAEALSRSAVPPQVTCTPAITKRDQRDRCLLSAGGGAQPWTAVTHACAHALAQKQKLTQAPRAGGGGCVGLGLL